MKYRKQRLYTFYNLTLTRKHVPIPSPSKESNKGLRIYPMKRRSVSVARDLKSHLEPWPPFAVSSQCLYYYRDVVGWGKLTDTSLLASFPLTPLPLEYLDYVLTLKRSSFPNVSLKAVTPLKEEREREKKTQERENKNRPLPEDTHPCSGSREASAEIGPCLPFCHLQRKPTRLLSLSPVRVPELQVPHSQETLAGITALKLEQYASPKNERKSANGREPA